MAVVQSGDLSHLSIESPSQTLSWASKVKQPPKNVIFSPTSAKTTFSAQSKPKDLTLQGYNKLSPTPKHIATEEESEKVVTKKKRKRKKKNNSEVQETVKSTNENIVYQEPPKFQDDEEFPDLISSSASVKCENKSNYSYSWGPRGSTEADKKQKNGGKKSKKPVQLDLGGMLTALEQRQTTEKSKQITKPIVLSVGSGVPVKPREPANVGKNPQSKPSLAPHNPLDSSAPLVKKGKQREVPKAKKPTSLKKIILKEREQRKQLNLSPSQEGTQPVIFSPDSTHPSGESHVLVEQHPPSPDHNDIEEGTESADTCAFPLDEPSPDVTDATEISVPVSQPSSNLPKIHSRRFREYCNQVLSKEVDTCVTELLKELVRFQDRLYLKDPVKAKTKRRLVMGLREVLKHLKLKKLKCVIISPNCEKIQSKAVCLENIGWTFHMFERSCGH